MGEKKLKENKYKESNLIIYNTMQITGIDYSKCINCKKCVVDCPSQLFSHIIQDGSTQINFADPNQLCIQCGHCLAICPVNCIIYQGDFKSSPIPPNFLEMKPSYNSLDNFLRNKRSIRHFSSKKVPYGLIEKILSTMRYAPSARNARNWKLLVITDKKEIQLLSKQIIYAIAITQKITQNWLIRKLLLLTPLRRTLYDHRISYSINRLLTNSKAGLDPIFFDAPCVVIIYSPKYGNLAGCDSGIITTYGMLAAESLGLGTCWIGIAQEVMMRLRKIRKFCGIPKGYFPWSVFVVGYPKYKYNRIPPRDPLEVTWREFKEEKVEKYSDKKIENV
ncbi:MAG: hypothetical protein DRO88_00810 [Promethearchaeia archaeon]|nr:MAG: hypothetical protein DRO88_00810 [Candidatus Lokiarchaeia archaeon]